MPTYDYRCAKCGEDIEVYQSFAETPLTKHEGCGGKLAKVISPAGIVLKGSGFYKTDNRSSSKKRRRRRRTRRSGEGVVERPPSPRAISDSVELELVGVASDSNELVRVRSTSTATPSPPSAWRAPRSASSAARASTRSSTTSKRSRRRRRSARRARRSRSATVGGRRVAFIPRHGRDHEYAPARMPAAGEPLGDAHARRAPGRRAVRGGLALARRSIPATSSCSTSSSTARGADADTFYDAGDAHHVSFADPVLPGRARARGRRRRHASACACTRAGRSS